MRNPLLLLPLALLGSSAAAQIETRIHRAVSLPFLRLDPRAPVVPRGEGTLSVGLTAANDLRRRPPGGPFVVQEDYEVERLLFRYRKGLPGRADLTVDVPIVSRGPGFLDPIIESWHRYILHVRNGRSDVPFGRSEVIVPGSDRFGSATGVGDVSVAYTREISPRLMATAAVELPTGNASHLLGSGGIDAALGLQWRVPIGRRLDLHLLGGAVAQGSNPELAGERRLVYQEAVVLEYRPNSRDRWILQHQGEASALRSGESRSDSDHRMLSLGYQRRLSDRQTVEAFFSEDGDFLNYRVPGLVNVAPDFSLGLRFTMKM